MQACQLDKKLAPVAGLGQGDMAHVELNIKVRILNPVGEIHIARHFHQPAAQHGHLVDGLFEALHDVLEAHWHIR